MGLSMPKFVTESYTSVKEKYYSFKNGYESIKESFKLAKTAYKMAKSLDTSKFTETQDPKKIIDAFDASGVEIPDTYKSLLKIIPEDTLKKVTNLLFESLSKHKASQGSNNAEEPQGHGADDQRGSSQDTESATPNFTIPEGVTETIGRMADAMNTTLKNTNRDFNSPASQSEGVSAAIGRMADAMTMSLKNKNADFDPSASQTDGVSEAIGRMTEAMTMPFNNTETDSNPAASQTDGVSEAIGRMTEAMTMPFNNTGRDSNPAVSQTEFIDVDPPSKVHYNPGYSEMKSDDDGESRITNRNDKEKVAEEQTNGPFGMGRDNFTNQQSLYQEDLPTFDTEEIPTYSSQESRYYQKPYRYKPYGGQSREEKEERDRINGPFGTGGDNFSYSQAQNQDRKPIFEPEEILSSAPRSDESRYYQPPHRVQADNNYTDQYSQSYKDEPNDFFYQTPPPEPQEDEKKDLPPLTKKLGEELVKRYGRNWRQQVPGFVQNPEISENIPDLGLGLGKESNKDMVISLSKVIKDLM